MKKIGWLFTFVVFVSFLWIVGHISPSADYYRQKKAYYALECGDRFYPENFKLATQPIRYNATTTVYSDLDRTIIVRNSDHLIIATRN